MDPTMIAEQPTGLVGWIMANGQVVAFIAQIFYWFAMIVLLAYAVWQYKRWVNFTLGVGRSGKLRTGEDVESDSKQKVSVEEFVE
ncbi:MAG: hypothetical protein U1E26_00245 [Coriobacteriia bacterium]|nr:hypothetical protein [Coriobacteriia bacterium]